jgi:hypothetical protein
MNEESFFKNMFLLLAQVGLTIFLPQPTKGWDCRYVPPHWLEFKFLNEY